MMRRIGALMMITVFYVGSRYAALSATNDWTVYLRYAGSIRIGMTLPEVRRVLHDGQAQLVGPDEVDQCAYLESPATPRGLGIMFSRGRVVRIDVYKPGIRTAAGISVGDTEDDVKRKYAGHIKVEPHTYNPETGHYLNYVPSDKADRNFGMVFETDAGKVTSFRTGTLAAIALVEGCS